MFYTHFHNHFRLIKTSHPSVIQKNPKGMHHVADVLGCHSYLFNAYHPESVFPFSKTPKFSIRDPHFH